MSIPKCIITKKGQALLAKTPSGAKVPVTRWQLGTGVLSPEQAVEDLEALVAPLNDLPISSCQASGSKTTILGQFVNTGMSAFVWEELGLWATDPDDGEILYAVGEARGDGEHIEAGAEKLREFIFGMELVFDNANEVTVVIDSSLIFATKQELEGKADREELDKKADLGEDGKVLPPSFPPSVRGGGSLRPRNGAGESCASPRASTGSPPRPSTPWPRCGPGSNGPPWTTTALPPPRGGPGSSPP